MLEVPDKKYVIANIEAVKNNIEKICAACGRDPAKVNIIAVTKNFTKEACAYAAEAGIFHIGENRVQEAMKKYGAEAEELDAGGNTSLRERIALRERITLHMIGRLQSNKVKKAVGLFDSIDSVDSLRLARQINECAAAVKKIMPVMIEVNSGDDPAKGGVPAGEAETLAGEIARLPALKLTGLMTVLPIDAEEDKKTQYFVEMYKKSIDISMKIMDNKSICLSMGMSQDYKQAVEAGSDFIRIGTSIFGQRG